jgi:hypothetical protein
VAVATGDLAAASAASRSAQELFVAAPFGCPARRGQLLAPGALIGGMCTLGGFPLAKRRPDNHSGNRPGPAATSTLAAARLLPPAADVPLRWLWAAMCQQLTWNVGLTGLPAAATRIKGPSSLRVALFQAMAHCA